MFRHPQPRHRHPPPRPRTPHPRPWRPGTARGREEGKRQTEQRQQHRGSARAPSRGSAGRQGARRRAGCIDSTDLLVLRDEIVHVGLGLSELHLEERKRATDNDVSTQPESRKQTRHARASARQCVRRGGVADLIHTLCRSDEKTASTSASTQAHTSDHPLCVY